MAKQQRRSVSMGKWLRRRREKARRDQRARFLPRVERLEPRMLLALGVAPPPLIAISPLSSETIVVNLGAPVQPIAVSSVSPLAGSHAAQADTDVSATFPAQQFRVGQGLERVADSQDGE